STKLLVGIVVKIEKQLASSSPLGMLQLTIDDVNHALHHGNVHTPLLDLRVDKALHAEIASATQAEIENPLPLENLAIDNDRDIAPFGRRYVIAHDPSLQWLNTLSHILAAAEHGSSFRPHHGCDLHNND